MTARRLRNTLKLFALLATSITTHAGDWTTETAQQAYLLKGCGADTGKIVLTLNTGTRVYRINSSSPIYRAALSVGEQAVAKGNPIQIYSISGYPTNTHRIQSGNGRCDDAAGIDILGISIDRKATIRTSPKPSANAGMVVQSSRNGQILTISGTKRTCDLLDLGGRVVAVSRPDADGIQSISLIGLRKGTFIVRSGPQHIRFTNL